MKHFLIIISVLVVSACQPSQTNVQNDPSSTTMSVNQETLKNEKIRNHQFLEGMYSDKYFPKFLVDKVKAILLELCFNIEQKKPANLSELYALTHASTEKINKLQSEFTSNQSEIETVAREMIAKDFDFISNAYGFTADIEELISTREW